VYLDLAFAQYPVTNPQGIRWVHTKNNDTELMEFLEFANITTSPEDFYRRNPGFFWPEHCYGYGSNNTNFTSLFPENPDDSTLPPRRNMTAIGYIANNNQIEKDVILQLQLIFERQQFRMPNNFHKYKFVRFNTIKEVDDYVRHPGYSFE